MNRKTPVTDAREVIFSRIREAAKAAGVRASVPMPPYDGRNGLSECYVDRNVRTSAFARRMEELRVSFVLCDTLQDVSEGLSMLSARMKWKNLAIQDSPRLRSLIEGIGPDVKRVLPGAGKGEIGGCEAGLVECLAMDAQTGAILIGDAEGATDVSAMVTTLVTVGMADRISGSLEEALQMAKRNGSLPPPKIYRQSHTADRVKTGGPASCRLVRLTQTDACEKNPQEAGPQSA